jgi:GT2 family glycosyltransferase
MSTFAANVDLSIITVNWNTGFMLLQFIESIIETIDNCSYEIIVVDNCSSDDSISVVSTRFPQVKVIANDQNLGFSKSANIALRESTGQYLLIAHPDVRFSTDSIEKLLSVLKTDKQIGIVGGNLIYPDGSYNKCAIRKRSFRREFIDFGFPFNIIDNKISSICTKFGKERNEQFWDHINFTESDSVWNACMMFKREVMDTIGGFSEDFFVWFADTDWCYRARKAGWKVIYYPYSRVVHFEIQSGSYINPDLVGYKIDTLTSASAMRRDLNTLLKHHYNIAFQVFSRMLGIIAILKAKAKILILSKPNHLRK